MSYFRPAADELFSHLLEIVNALLVGADDIEQFVAIDIGDLKLGARAAGIVKLMPSPTGFAIFSFQFEPVEHGGLIATGISATVSPPAFAGHKVHQTIAIHVGQAHTVRLGEAGVNFVFLPVSIGALFMPPDAKCMGTTGENILISVTIKIIGEHLGGLTKRHRVELPRATL